MARKLKIPPEEKIRAVEAYLDGKLGYTEAIRKYEINDSVWYSWVSLYKTNGPDGLIPQATNRKYSKELKLQVVQEYLAGGIMDLSRKVQSVNPQILQYRPLRFSEPEVVTP